MPGTDTLTAHNTANYINFFIVLGVNTRRNACHIIPGFFKSSSDKFLFDFIFDNSSFNNGLISLLFINSNSLCIRALYLSFGGI